MIRNDTTLLPPGMSLERSADGVTITRRWRNLFAYALTPLALLTTGICLALFRATQEANFADPIRLIPLTIGLAGLALAYFLLARFVNRTRVHVSPRRVEIEHGPLPWQPGLTLPADRITRIYVQAAPVTYGSRRATFYHLWAEQTDGSRLRLLGSDVEQAQAEFFRREIDRGLGLTDRRS